MEFLLHSIYCLANDKSKEVIITQVRIVVASGGGEGSRTRRGYLRKEDLAVLGGILFLDQGGRYTSVCFVIVHYVVHLF